MKLYKRCLADQCEEATSEDIIAAFNALPIWARMRAVHAGTSPEVDRRRGLRPFMAAWPNLADQWDREDAEKAARDQEVEDLAQLIRSVTGRLGSWDTIVESAREEYREQARAVLKAGYRKQDEL